MEIKILQASSEEMLLQQIPKAFEEGWIVPPFEKITCENGWHKVKVIKVPFIESLIETLGKRRATHLTDVAKNAVEKAFPEHDSSK